jgi:glucose-6-phosphate isomerase
VLPYADRVSLLGRYLQQLIMESIGKERDRKGNVVRQGLTVLGNKGSTDQHSFVQQLREGRNDFFVTFVEVLAEPDRSDPSSRLPTGDYLYGFLHGTRAALTDNGRESMTLTMDRLDAERLGALIALFERAVGLYAELIDVNAYHQPGVEAGKKAAKSLLGLQDRVLAQLTSSRGTPKNVSEVADELGEPDQAEDIFHILQRQAAHHSHGIHRLDGENYFQAKFLCQ